MRRSQKPTRPTAFETSPDTNVERRVVKKNVEVDITESPKSRIARRREMLKNIESEPLSKDYDEALGNMLNNPLYKSIEGVENIYKFLYRKSVSMTK